MHETADENVVPLVEALDALPACSVVSACGGHDEPEEGEWSWGTWYVKFRLDHTEEGWRTLEFLAWLFNRDGRERSAFLLPDAPAPYLNEPGRVLAFVIRMGDPDADGRDSPKAWASWVREAAEGYYVPVTAG